VADSDKQLHFSSSKDYNQVCFGLTESVLKLLQTNPFRWCHCVTPEV